MGSSPRAQSTLARWLALQLAEALKAGQQSVEVPAAHVRPDGQGEEMISLGIARLPVLIRLADYAATRWPAPNTDKRLPLRLFLGKHLEHLLEPGQENRAMYNLVKDYLAAGRVTFILDGLDTASSRYGIMWLPGRAEYGLSRCLRTRVAANARAGRLQQMNERVNNGRASTLYCWPTVRS